MKKKIIERKEIIPGYLLGDTVILKEETELTRNKNIKLGTVGFVSKDDNEKTLRGWLRVDVDKGFKEEIDKMSPDKVEELYNQLVKIGKIKNSDKIDVIAKNLDELDENLKNKINKQEQN
jgi:hypothetical protein